MPGPQCKMIGRKFGKLTVLSRNEDRRYWNCICDCGNTTKSYGTGLTNGCIKSCKCLKHFTDEEYDKRTKERFLDSFEIENDCWIWKKCLHRQKYGTSVYRSKTILAHRLSWMLHNGKIPDGLDVCHKCDNPSCVNPEHLFLGTHSENMIDAFSKKRKSHKGEKHPRAKLTESDIHKIFELSNYGMDQSQISRIYKVRPSHIGQILHKKMWKHIHK